MKHTVVALLLSTGLLSSGCAHGSHHIDGTMVIAIVGAAVVSAALLTAGGTGSQCDDPLGRCNTRDFPPPESR